MPDQATPAIDPKEQQKQSIDAQIAALKAQRAALDIPEETKSKIAEYLKDSAILAYIKAEIDKQGKKPATAKVDVASQEEIAQHGPRILSFIKKPKTAKEIKDHMTTLDGTRVAPILRALKDANKLEILGGPKAGAGRKYQATK